MGERLTRPQMAARLTAEFQDGWVVNLGTGMPTLCSDLVPPDRTVIFHSENGLLGYGGHAYGEDASPYVVNAGVQHVVLGPYASVVNHADSFGIVRGGRLDVGVLGAYEVGANGDLANWKTAGRSGGGIGGAMDIAASAQRIFVIMEHTQRTGEPRLLRRCSLPITAPGVVRLVVTDIGLFEPVGDAFRVLEVAPGFTPEEVQSLTEAPLLFDDVVKEVRV
jgi:3-oxoacid CoA-transferase B subunit